MKQQKYCGLVRITRTPEYDQDTQTTKIRVSLLKEYRTMMMSCSSKRPYVKTISQCETVHLDLCLLTHMAVKKLVQDVNLNMGHYAFFEAGELQFKNNRAVFSKIQDLIVFEKPIAQTFEPCLFGEKHA